MKLDDYCPYCAANANAASSYDCGTVPGSRTVNCMEGEIAILRVEKEHAFGQAYDLEWQRNIYADVVDIAKNVLMGTTDIKALGEAVDSLDRLGTPMRDRADELTMEYRRRKAERAERLSR